MKLEFSQQIF